MPKTEDQYLTPQQRKWFASVREGLERDTGKTLTEWIAIAETCPETAPRARLKWFKDTHGLLQNRASYVIGEAFPSGPTWREPDALRQTLWTEEGGRLILEVVEKLAVSLPDVVTGQRKSFSAFSRRYQFAALRPIKGGGAMLGLAVPVDASQRLQTCKNESWSERLPSRTPLSQLQEVNDEVQALLKLAWSLS